MCGICGIVNFSEEKASEFAIKKMMSLMKHRGPDDEGIYVSNNIGLGHVRLSIIDLSYNAHQPMHSTGGENVIVFNGEIYNYIELKRELSVNYDFRTESDTEVILAAYEKWGTDCLERFNGDFSFAIYNKRNKTLFCARDRYGIKPFYYYMDDEKLYFASEIKSILPYVEQVKVNESVLLDYLLYNRTDFNNQTFFRDITKLPHGSYLLIKDFKIDIKKWYNLEDKINNTDLSNFNYANELKRSIEFRLRSDVPVGSCLSGGLDSSSIVSLILSDNSINLCNTFSAVYGSHEESDESTFIKEYEIYSNRIRMDYIYPDSIQFLNDIPRFIYHIGEPISNVGPYIQYKVMELASKKVKVVLDGQGGDEQLGGYHDFYAIYFKELLLKLKLLKFTKELLYYIKKQKSIEQFKYLIFYMLPSNVKQNLTNNMRKYICNDFYNENKQNSNLSETIYSPHSFRDALIQHFEYKLEHLLKWEDLNSMAFSIEARVPMLDHNLVEKVLSLPTGSYIKDGVTKHVLRKDMKSFIPDSIHKRKDKKGFSNPSNKWIKDPHFKEFIFGILTSSSFLKRGYLNSEICKTMYIDHLKGKSNNIKDIWKCINLEMWFRQNIDK